MIRIAIAVALFWSYCGLMSYLAKKDHPHLARKGMLAGSVAVYLAMVCGCTFAFLSQITGYNAIPYMCGLVLVFIAGIVIGYPYLAYLVGELFDRAHAAGMSLDRMKVRETYDLAAKAEREKRLDDALALYRQGATDHPADAEPLRRMAEIHAGRGELAEAISRMKEAYPKVEGSEEKASLAFRAADLLVRAGRSGEAREFLESVARDLAGTPFETYARGRLAGL